MKRNELIHYLPYCGVLAGATLILTRVGFTFPGTHCYVHIGAGMAVLIAFLLPPVYSAASVGLGMGLCDLITGYGAWAPFTLVIRFSQVFLLSHFLHKEHNKKRNAVIGFLLSGVIDVGGYYLTEALLYGNWVAPLATAAAEVFLNIFGVALGLAAITLFKKTNLSKLIR